MIRTHVERAAEINENVRTAREEISLALHTIEQVEGSRDVRAQYEVLARARHRIAEAYRAARGLDLRTDLDQSLWFALDEAALWQDLEAERYRRLAGTR
ncbi:hypothetical protein [Amycolatopsis sp. NBC_01480]|jgi:hypothetical protein|uniref:hypothetical protein n=1 Tax=Amycolatopsis sp. NBC_01480 TaxID=2903562 RepID=UPI002E28D27C|nr:hypothetical protein [Amycolatopsis sp. NBC_01480]